MGETTDKRRAHALAKRGELIPLVRGVYAWVVEDVDAAVLAHAVLSVFRDGISPGGERRWSAVHHGEAQPAHPHSRRQDLALKLNGEDDRLTPQDFLQLAQSLDVSVARAADPLSGFARQVSDAARAFEFANLELPAGAASLIEEVRRLAITRGEPFAQLG